MANIMNIKGKYLGMTKVEGTQNRYKAKFHVDGKEWSFTIFLPWTKKDGSPKKGTDASELKLEQWYNIGYTEYKAGDMKYPAKTAIAFFHIEDVNTYAGVNTDNPSKSMPESTKSNQSGTPIQTQTSPQTHTDTVKYELKDIMAIYREKVKDNDRNLASFCQVYLAANHKEVYQKLKQFYETKQDADLGELL